MNISGLKGLLIAGTLLIATTPQALDARTVDGNGAVQCCEEKADKKSEAQGCGEKKAEGGCEKAEGCCKASKKVSQLPGEDEGAGAGATAGSGEGSSEAGSTGATSGTASAATTAGSTEATGEGETAGEGGEGAAPQAGESEGG
jgi:hypothetical protein